MKFVSSGGLSRMEALSGKIFRGPFLAHKMYQVAKWPQLLDYLPLDRNKS